MSAVRVGLIGDTHGLLRPEAVAALDGVELVLHTGDVGDPAILDRLAAIAPVRAVRGNVDHGAWAERLPSTEVVETGGATLYMLHIVDRLDLDPAAAGFDAVLFGHSHRPETRREGGVLYLNPGSAGPRRFRLPVTLMRLAIEDGRIEPELIELV